VRSSYFLVKAKLSPGTQCCSWCVPRPEAVYPLVFTTLWKRPLQATSTARKIKVRRKYSGLCASRLEAFRSSRRSERFEDAASVVTYENWKAALTALRCTTGKP